jgi:hypothetical protein
MIQPRIPVMAENDGETIILQASVWEIPRLSTSLTEASVIHARPGNSVSIVSGYGRSRFDPRQKRKDFSCSLCVQTDSGAHQASCTMGTGSLFPGAKARSRSDWPLTPIWCRDHEWAGTIVPLPPSASMTCSETALLTSVNHFLYLCWRVPLRYKPLN